MNDTVRNLLVNIAGIHDLPPGAHSLRLNGKSVGLAGSAAVSILPKAGGKGIDIRVKPGTKGETIHIPVVIDHGGVTDVVANDFFIGEDCEDIVIVAGCGMHGDGCGGSRHDGIHHFRIGRDSSVMYREIHYGSGRSGDRVFNPVTDIHLEAGARFDMDSSQLEGVDSTRRVTRGRIGAGSVLTVREKLMTFEAQRARSEFEIHLDGEEAKAGIVSRSVAREDSFQEFFSVMTGKAACEGRTECDAIIMDRARVRAIPQIDALHPAASLVHEAAIGRIAGEQLTKLMTLGLTKDDAEKRIVAGFLR